MCSQKKVAVFKENIPIVLASSSPRRQKLLQDLGLVFQISVVDTEPLPFKHELPSAYVVRAAESKAINVSTINPHGVTIGADTVVVYNDGESVEIVGKPCSEEDAFAMLSRFQGGKYQVITGCCLVWPFDTKQASPQYESFYDSTYIHFACWPDAVLSAYIQTEEPKDKAGSFAIQGIGAFLIDAIEGNYTTVLGLPVSQVIQRLLTGGAITVIN